MGLVGVAAYMHYNMEMFQGSGWYNLCCISPSYPLSLTGRKRKGLWQLDIASSAWPVGGGILTTAKSLLPAWCCHFFSGHVNTGKSLWGTGWRAKWVDEQASGLSKGSSSKLTLPRRPNHSATFWCWHVLWKNDSTKLAEGIWWWWEGRLQLAAPS